MSKRMGSPSNDSNESVHVSAKGRFNQAHRFVIILFQAFVGYLQFVSIFALEFSRLIGLYMTAGHCAILNLLLIYAETQINLIRSCSNVSHRQLMLCEHALEAFQHEMHNCHFECSSIANNAHSEHHHYRDENKARFRFNIRSKDTNSEQ